MDPLKCATEFILSQSTYYRIVRNVPCHMHLQIVQYGTSVYGNPTYVPIYVHTGQYIPVSGQLQQNLPKRYF